MNRQKAIEVMARALGSEMEPDTAWEDFNAENQEMLKCFATAAYDALVAAGLAVMTEADKRIAEAVHECKSDTFECPKCGHSEPWWTESNADYASREPDTNDKTRHG